MKNIYFWSLKIQKRDLVLIILAFIIVGAGIVCRVSAYENTVASALSWKMANKIIVLDPGHGGFDPGAVGTQGTLEKDVVLQIAHKLKKMLSSSGAVVVMTRESDEDLSDNQASSIYTRKRQDLTRRVEMANKKKADIYISLHLNSYPSPRWSGAQTFYHPGQGDAKMLAESIQKEIIEMLGNTDRQALAEDFFTNRLTRMPAVTVEMGFLSNPREEKLLISDDYQDKMAKAIYSGVAKYFAVKAEKSRK